MSEKAVQAAVKRTLRALGAHVSDLSQPRASMQTPGLPDLFVMHPAWGLGLWIEVKGPKTRVSKAQRAWHAVAERAGVVVLVVRSTDELAAGLERLGAPIRGGDR